MSFRGLLCAASLALFGLVANLSGCERISALAGAGTTSTPVQSSEAVSATSEEDQWEYLVVSFGKTQFSEIEESIKTGQSKLVAFQEFADLLSGHEGLNLQTRLDILGRFGWELVGSIGQVGGDQQYLLKRERIKNRIELEQAAIHQLGEILRQESAEKERQLEAFLEELERRKQSEQHADPEGLVEMDALEEEERERAASQEAEAVIKSWFPTPPESQIENTTVKSIEVNARASEKTGRKGAFDYGGSINVVLDGTDVLLFDGNKYRLSDAEKLRKEYFSAVYRSNRENIQDGFRWNFEVRVVVNHGGKEYVVTRDTDYVNLRRYQ